MWLLAACAPPAPSDSVAVGDSAADTAPADTQTETGDDTGAETGEETATDSGPDTGDDTGGDTAPSTWRSALYPEDWSPDDTTAEGWFLHDFSYAGYRASEAPLPTVGGPEIDAVALGADPTGATDSAAAIQAALDAAAGGGVVVLPKGTFWVGAPLVVRASGVVLRGAGSGATFLRFTGGSSYSALLTFRGALVEGADLPLAADAPARASTVTLEDASGLAPGDEVHVGQVITAEWVEDHGMTGTWVEFDGQWRAFHRRTVVSVHGNVVTLDVPLRNALNVRDGASVRPVSGYLTEVGVEALSVATATDLDTAWSLSQVHAITLDGVKDGWVRDVRSWSPPDAPDGAHLSNCGVLVTDSRRVTVADGRMEAAQNRGTGGNGYLYEVRRSNDILFVDLEADLGRHNFIQNWDFGTSGVVWLRTASTNGNARLGDWDPIGYTAYSEYHHSLATANLVDHSVATDGWQAVNRQDESSGAGHSATQSVFWNLTGGGYLRSLQFGDGYVIGTDDVDLHVDPEEWDWADAGEGTAPEDYVEGVGAADRLDPPSLFEDQLRRRLGG